MDEWRLRPQWRCELRRLRADRPGVQLAERNAASQRACAQEPAMKNLILGVVMVAVVLAANAIVHAAEPVPYKWANVAIFGGGFVSGIVTHPTERGLIYCRT